MLVVLTLMRAFQMEKKILLLMLVTMSVVFLADLKRGDIIWAIADYLIVSVLALVIMFKDSAIVGQHYE